MTSDLPNKIREAALNTLSVEKTAIQDLESAINEVFVRLVTFIHDETNRVVLSGIGKSAIVSQKIVATLNSTGTPAMFMHAADAIHGDLGMIQPNDLLLVLSKSGETEELKVLLPIVKSRGNKVAAMVANPESWLARQADFVLITPVKQEADPNNLAPTASSTAQMALGDALAMALLALRGFTPEQFAGLHPGGSLGKQLYLRVCDIFPKNEKPVVLPDTPLHQTIIEMTSKRLGCTVVLDEQDKIRGIITDGDLRRMLNSSPVKKLEDLRAADVMTEAPKTIASGAMAVDALALMRKHSITQLVVEEAGTYLGIVHLHDLLREGIV
jgi:arabinose-5-phosphate isomerase